MKHFKKPVDYWGDLVQKLLLYNVILIAMFGFAYDLKHIIYTYSKVQRWRCHAMSLLLFLWYEWKPNYWRESKWSNVLENWEKYIAIQ